MRRKGAQAGAAGSPATGPDVSLRPTPGLAVEVRALAHRFGTVTALDGIAFTVAPGELYGLVGPDGAGKTTCLRCVAGVMVPDGGAVFVDGLDPADSRTGVREVLGYMPQRYSLYGDLSVAENLRFFGDLFCLTRAQWHDRTERLLRITRLDRFQDRRADALSGGMYKKLALACALLHEPKVLVLDEPTNGVDPISRAELWDLLHEFAGGGMAVIVSTSYMDEASRCHRVGLAHRGRLVLEGAPGALVRAFEDEVLHLAPTAGRPPDGAWTDAVEEVLAAAGDAVAAVTPLGSGLRAVVRREAAAGIAARVRAAGADATVVAAGFEDLFLARVPRGEGVG